MSDSYTLRSMEPSDGPALQNVMGDDRPTAGLSLTTRFLVDPYQAWKALKPNMIGVVAEGPDADGIVGAATVAFEDIQYNGRVLPSAFLENLKVHHTYRKRGIGKALAAWRIAQAHGRFGDNGVVVTTTSTDNIASQNTMKTWRAQFFSPMRVMVRPALNRAPGTPDGLTARAPEPSEYVEVCEKSNRFYAAYQLYAPLTPERLDSLRTADPQVYHYRVVVDEAGNLVAGVMLSLRGLLLVDEISNVPTPVRVLGRVLGILPPDGRIRMSEVNYLWYDRLDAAQHLWKHIRWEFRDRANSFTSNFDPRSPLAEVYRIKPWHQPKVELVIAVRGPEPMDTQKLVCGTLRG